MKKIYSYFAFFVTVAIFTPILVFGATFKAGDEISIKSGSDVRDNLYAAGGTVSVGGNILGDLLVAGGTIMVSKNVSDDIAAAGGTITILGNSGGDVRVAGGNIFIGGDVAGDLIITGGSVTVSPDVSIGKDLILAGGQVVFDGNVLGNAQIMAGNATINGHIKGTSKITVSDKLVIGDEATIDGDLEYTAPKADVLTLSTSAVIQGKTIFTESKTIKRDDAKNFIFAVFGTLVVFKLLSFIIVALVLVWLFRRFSTSVVSSVIENPLSMLGKGFVTVVVVPIAAIILLVTIFGAPFGIMMMLSYGLLLILSGIYSGVVTGVWLSKAIRKSSEVVLTWKNVTGGVVLLAIVKLIPFIGWIVWLFMILVTIGSLADMLYKKLLAERQA